MQLDLVPLDSIRNFTHHFRQRYYNLASLTNIAGVFGMKREEIRDVFEKTMGTNDLGPFLLIHLVRSILEKTPDSRINLNSNVHYYAKLDLGNLNFECGSLPRAIDLCCIQFDQGHFYTGINTPA
jgi:NAD(P)-dependent dehydrogenase (short-subunit alcohol dehydrogenase family)